MDASTTVELCGRDTWGKSVPARNNQLSLGITTRVLTSCWWPRRRRCLEGCRDWGNGDALELVKELRAYVRGNLSNACLPPY